jgi:hypothetical protein
MWCGRFGTITLAILGIGVVSHQIQLNKCLSIIHRKRGRIYFSSSL